VSSIPYDYEDEPDEDEEPDPDRNGSPADEGRCLQGSSVRLALAIRR
jgi:hypothetical protein